MQNEMTFRGNEKKRHDLLDDLNAAEFSRQISRR